MTQHETKTRLLDATLNVVRAKGYNATRVEDICAAAAVTKGSFFHHFKSKDDLVLAAVAHWDARTSALFADAPYHLPADPLDRLLAYVDYRKALLIGGLADFTCFNGMIIQEAYETRPELAQACERSMSNHAKSLEADIAEAMAKYGVKEGWSAAGLALHTQAVLQGAFILAKAKGRASAAAETVDHLRRYLELLFGAAVASAKPQ